MIQSVVRAAEILRALRDASPRMGVTEISARLSLAKGTVHGLLRTLEAQGLVEQDDETGKYQLGMGLFQLGNAVLENNELRSRSLVWADGLAARVQQAVRVGVLHGDHILVVHHVFRPDDSVQILEVGASIPWHASALGHAVVAHLPASRQHRLLDAELPALTGGTLTDARALEKRLAEVAAAGYAVEDQEAILGESCVAAAVFDSAGDVVGSIGVAGPAERLVGPDGPSTDTVMAVRDSARGLSRDLGARWPHTG